ncbi:MAG: TerB family tellurite resistance protein [Pseudomonadota bacterium]|nr:TerB family tellurite resistance protein [Pseudomonadota bacterium]MDQ2703787.1 TerB family tellurite resistance protein [Pseudomonadota bacterium]
MFDRIIAFLKDLPSGETGRGRPGGSDDPRVAAAALMYHVMDADGVRHDAEWERMKEILAEAYGLSGQALDRLVAAGGEADDNAVDLYAFTSVLKRHLDETARIEFVGLMWEIVFADGELHELEDHTLWRIAELIGVDRRDRILQRRKAQAEAPDAIGRPTED